jgi:hypothetical protein
MPAAEDRNLAPEQFPELNRQFYAGEFGPADYLTQRFRSVFLAAQAPERLPGAFDSDLSVGDIKASWPTPESWDASDVRDYVSTETTVLLHHTAEALFRLYLAHSQSPECPWLAVARLRIPSHFKASVHSFLASRRDAETHEQLTWVFYGRRSPENDPRGLWPDAKDGLVRLVSILGSRLLEQAPLYNSAKHGLSLVPGAAAMSFGDQSGPFAINASGPSITHLTVSKGQHGKRWAQETVWLNPEQDLALIGLAIHQVRNLWAVAKHRYAGEPFDSTALRPVTVQAVEAVMNHPPADGVRVSVPSMSMELLYRSAGSGTEA